MSRWGWRVDRLVTLLILEVRIPLGLKVPLFYPEAWRLHRAERTPGSLHWVKGWGVQKNPLSIFLEQVLQPFFQCSHFTSPDCCHSSNPGSTTRYLILGRVQHCTSRSRIFFLKFGDFFTLLHIKYCSFSPKNVLWKKWTSLISLFPLLLIVSFFFFLGARHYGALHAPPRLAQSPIAITWSRKSYYCK